MNGVRTATGAAPAGEVTVVRRGPSFDLVSHWRIDAPVHAVWGALTEPAFWPYWWPYVRGVRTVRAGGADGVGAIRRIDWRTRLPYSLAIEVEVAESVRYQLLRGRSRGQLHGEGLWLLREDGGGTHVTYYWRVTPTTRWMRWLTPLLAPLFRWNHDAVMRAGEAGLRRHLAGLQIEARPGADKGQGHGLG